MAAAAGVKIGRVVTFTEETPYYPPIYAQYAVEYDRGAVAEAPAPSIEPGSKELTVNVSVTYEIE
jgi:uncharacterized protein YggE